MGKGINVLNNNLHWVTLSPCLMTHVPMRLAHYISIMALDV